MGIGCKGWDRTTDRPLNRRLLYQLSYLAMICSTAILALGPRTAASEPRAVELDVSTPVLACTAGGGHCTLTAVASRPAISERVTTAPMNCSVRAGGEVFRSSGYASVNTDSVSGRVSVDLDRERRIEAIRCEAYLR